MGTNSLSTMAPRRLWWVTCVVALTLVLNTVEAGANNLGHDTNEGLSNEICDASLTATTASDANEEVSNEATNSDHINANANNLGHDTNAMAHEAATPSASVLRAELSALKLGGLNRRAVAANVDPNALEMAQDKGDKAAIIELVLQSSGAHDIAGTPVSHEATNSDRMLLEISPPEAGGIFEGPVSSPKDAGDNEGSMASATEDEDDLGDADDATWGSYLKRRRRSRPIPK